MTIVSTQSLEAAIGFNRGRLLFAPALVSWVGRAAESPDLARAATEEADVGEAFALLVHAAQARVLTDPGQADGKFGPATIRAIRRRLGMQSRSIGLARDGIEIPERQVWKGPLGYPDRFLSRHLGPFYVSGGFMEDHGHSRKPTTHAIFSAAPETVTTLDPSDRNLGFDYVVTSPGKEVRAWYGGLVLASGLDGGYGHRVTIETDVAFVLHGQEHTVYQAYGHNAANHVKKGAFVEPGQVVATMGGTGEGGAVRYGEHVDLRTWITDGSRRIDVSPNVLDRSLPSSPAPPAPGGQFVRLVVGATLVGFAVGVLVWWKDHPKEEGRA